MSQEIQPTVVLLHGLFGFRRMLWWEYFRSVPNLLENMGLRVLVTKVSMGGRIEEHGRQLADQLKTEPGPLHLIAHSMGGVDARHYITHLGGHEKVASLTTLASPHRGSPAADFVTSGGFSLFHTPGARDLKTAPMAEFNGNTPDHPDVIYRSYSAARPGSEIPWPVRRYWRVIHEAEGDNDSQVSLSSAQWGNHIASLEADHFELIGLNIWLHPFIRRKPFDHLALYRDIGQWILEQEKSG